MTMHIRKLTRDDAPAFRELRLTGLRASPEAFSESYEEFAANSVEEIAARIPDDARSPYGFILGGFTDEGELAGCVALMRERFRKRSHKAILWGMYVRPAARRRGLARRLVTELITQARTLPNIDQIILNVATENTAACRLYESCGFRSFGTEPRALRVDGRFYDQEHMILDL